MSHLALNDNNEPLKDPVEETEMNEEEETCKHRNRVLLGRVSKTNYWKCTDCGEQWQVKRA